MELWCEKSTEIYNNATAEDCESPAKNLIVEIVENRTGSVRAFAPPSPKIRKNAVRHFNSFASCQAQLLGKMKIILIWYFFTFCLLEISCDREGVLFAKDYHLLFIIFWMMLLIQKYYYLRIIIICTAFAFEYHSHLRIIRIWISFAFEYHNRLNIIIVWKSFAFGNHNQIIIIRIWISFAFEYHNRLNIIRI